MIDVLMGGDAWWIWDLCMARCWGVIYEGRYILVRQTALRQSKWNHIRERTIQYYMQSLLLIFRSEKQVRST